MKRSGAFDGQPVHIPADVNAWPDIRYLKWHTHGKYSSHPISFPRIWMTAVRTLRWPV